MPPVLEVPSQIDKRQPALAPPYFYISVARRFRITMMYNVSICSIVLSITNRTKMVMDIFCVENQKYKVFFEKNHLPFFKLRVIFGYSASKSSRQQTGRSFHTEKGYLTHHMADSLYFII